MIWALAAVALVAWFIGLVLGWGPIVHILLLAGAVLLVIQLLNEREAEG